MVGDERTSHINVLLWCSFFFSFFFHNDRWPRMLSFTKSSLQCLTQMARGYIWVIFEKHWVYWFDDYCTKVVSGPHSKTNLNQTPTYEWCMVRCRSKRTPKRHVTERYWSTCITYTFWIIKMNKQFFFDVFIFYFYNDELRRKKKIYTSIMKKIHIWALKVLRKMTTA